MKHLLRKLSRYKITITILSAITIFVSLAIVTVYTISFFLGPPDLINEQNTIYYSDDGDVIGEEKGAESRYQVELEEISPHIIDATLAIEDQHFYDHNGFDFKRIASAVIVNLRSFSLKEGASTLTQQYARNLFLTHDKTWLRKITEAFYTIRIEMHYSKDEILEGYLNTIYFGHGSYGVEAASRYFFNKNASDVTIAEAAMLAGIPKGPKFYSPINDKTLADQRQQRILQLLKDQQKITKEEYDSAISENLHYKQANKREGQSISPYFQDSVLKEAESILKLDQETIRSSGYKIYTTLHEPSQKQFSKKASEELDKKSDIQIGGLAIDPHTGAIKAMVGGRDYRESSFNRAISAKRMPGSTFKPFLYYAAIEKNYTPSTKLLSEPTVFEHKDDQYQPKNFNNYYANEPITLAQAMALSDNIYAVKTHLFLGVDELISTAKKFGITDPLPEVPSLALGTASVTIQQMVTGYSMLANGGHEIKPYTIEKIVDSKGKTVYEHDLKQGEQILDEQTAFILTDLMTGMFDPMLDGYMSVTGSPIMNQLTQTYAGKSGSTDYDSWMIGYSPSLVTGVWLGYDNNKPLNPAKDHSYAKQIWADFMEAAHDQKETQSFSIPTGLVRMPIDPETGKIATPYCPTSRQMYFKQGTEPQTHCTEHFPSDEPEPNIPERQQPEDKKGILKRLFDLFSLKRS